MPLSASMEVSISDEFFDYCIVEWFDHVWTVTASAAAFGLYRKALDYYCAAHVDGKDYNPWV